MRNRSVWIEVAEAEPGGMSHADMVPTQEDIERHLLDTYGDVQKHGWRVRMRHWYGYIDADHVYEAFLDRLVTEGCSWLDVGGGRDICPGRERLSATLAGRCGLLVGVDPSENLAHNPWVHERAKCLLEEYRSERLFDLVTMRMVAEHIRDPEAVVSSLARLIKPGGMVMIYTPNRWSAGSIAAALVPFSLHPHITNFLYERDPEDTFPTLYKMNTKRRLRNLFLRGGFREVAFAYLDNCSTFQRFRFSCVLELSLWWTLKQLGITYPTNHLLGVYEKNEVPV